MMKNIEMMKVVGIRTMRMMVTRTTMVINDDCEAKEQKRNDMKKTHRKVKSTKRSKLQRGDVNTMISTKQETT